MSWYVLLKEADADARLQGLIKQFPKVNPEVINLAFANDPSPNKQYCRFILQWLIGGSIRLPEDGGRLKQALNFFAQNLRKFQIKDLSQYKTFNELEGAIDSLQGVNLQSQRQMTRDVKMQGSKTIYEDKEWRVVEMTTPEAVFELGRGTKWCTTGDQIDEETGKPEGYGYAKQYLSEGPLYLFLQNVGGKWQKYAQGTKDLSQIMDVTDVPISKPPPSFIQVMRNLNKQNIFSNYNFFDNFIKDVDYKEADEDLLSYGLSQNQNGEYPQEVISTVINKANKYSTRFPRCEKAFIFTDNPINMNSHDSRNYKKTGVINGDIMESYLDALEFPERLTEHEPIILRSDFALEYWRTRYCAVRSHGRTDYVTYDEEKRWPELEKALMSNPYQANQYTRYLSAAYQNEKGPPQTEEYLLNSIDTVGTFKAPVTYAVKMGVRWPALENKIIQIAAVLKARDEAYEIDSASILYYITNVVKERWLEVEPYMFDYDPDAFKYIKAIGQRIPEYENKLLNTNLVTSIEYSKDIIKDRWPELEQRIKQLSDKESVGQLAAYYAKQVMRKRWIEMEPIIFADPTKEFAKTYRYYVDSMIIANKKSWYKIAQAEGKQPWQMTRGEYLDSQYTGYISSSAYRNYATSEGISSFVKYEKYPNLIETVNVNNQPVEIRSCSEPRKYVKTDENDEIVRDSQGMAMYLSEEEMKQKGYAMVEVGIAAFVNQVPIGFANDEFGSSGIWVVNDFQRKGIGQKLLWYLHKFNPKLEKNKIGQMTGAGSNLTKSHHKNLVQRAINEGKDIPQNVLQEYPDFLTQAKTNVV